MRKGMAGLIIVLCCGAFLSGCAKKEIVKGEETAVPSAPSAVVKEPTPPIKEAPVKEQPIKETPIASAEETSRQLTTGKTAKEEVSLERIHFDFDSYILTQSSRDILYKNAEYLLKNTGMKVQIEGHCDERGSDEYNLALGEKRAKAAQSYLVTLGVQKERLSSISYGKEKPLDPGHDEAAWAKNRRDEFVIMK